jgi:D-proline reductase (dithiol) PrdB
VEILEDRAAWEAAFRAGWLAHYERTGTTDFKQYNRPRNSAAQSGPGVDLNRSRLVLISSAGGYLPTTQAPFDAANPLGDYSIRLFPSTTPLADIAYAHDHYDHTAVNADPQVLLPLGHLAELASEGRIGGLTPNVISFMGYQPDVGRVLDELIPAIRAAVQAEGADAALLVPS